MALATTRTDLSAAVLRAAACRSDDSDQARRLLALALVMEEASEPQRRGLRAWIGRHCGGGKRPCGVPHSALQTVSRGLHNWSAFLQTAQHQLCFRISRSVL